MSIEQGFNDYIDSIDGYYEGDFDDDFYPPKVNVYSEPHLPIVDFSEGDKVRLTKGLTFDKVCIIVKKTDKAILFKTDEGSFVFWLPKSVIFMKKGEEKKYRIKDWATITNIAKQRR